ncbi:MAG: zf-HC2 domain-containing protein [Acidobacteriota bacterium]
MRCEEVRSMAGEYVEGALGAVAFGRVERHLDACGDCRALVTDLRAIRAAAFTLERREPPARLRDAILARAAAEPRRPLAVGPLQGTWLAAAAALLAVTTVGLYQLVDRPAPAQPAASASADSDADVVASVEANLQAAEVHYERAIADLEKIARSDSETLDPQVAAVLQKNLLVVDQAIDESRAALREQPESQNAQESLFDAMWTKVALLQQTVELVNEMRKGNQAEAGRIIRSLNQP